MKQYFFLTTFGCAILSLSPLWASTITVTSSADTNTAGTLRNALLSAQSGDTINFSTAVTSITLTNPLPAITQQTLTISADSSFPVTINGANFQIFSVVQPGINTGLLTIENIYFSGGLSKGGDGGLANGSGGGGGGGAGGGGGLYIHTGSNVTLQGVQLFNNQAEGGAGGSNAGGVNAGGGGGGFCSGAGTQTGKGGDGTNSANGGGGGGGGGNSTGGNGGSDANGTDGGSTSMVGGGGGGGSGKKTGGKSYVTIYPTITTNAGGGTNSNNGGGGGGMGGAGKPGSGSGGGEGGIGIGSDTYFGGGGGGGAISTNVSGGDGYGTGGGGGSFNGHGGDGGVAGGGGGGAGNPSVGIGGMGGFGGGGGGGMSAGGGSIFGGGTGGFAGATSGGGGGGAGMGGNIFIQDQAQLTLGDSVSISGGTAIGGAAGAGGTTAATNGIASGADIFIRSGGTLLFTNSLPITIASSIESNVLQGGQTVAGQGGLVMNGTGTVSLDGTNTYTSSTTINSGTIIISANEALGDTTLGTGGNSVTIQNGTLQTTSTFPSPRLFSLTGSLATINTNSLTTLTLTGLISGSGSLTKQGLGTLALIPSSANTYTGNTTIGAGTLEIQADSALGHTSGNVTMSGASTLSVAVPVSPGQITSSRHFTLQTGSSTISVTSLTPGTTSYLLTGAIQGAGQLIKTGDQTLLLAGANSYSGGTIINNGTLVGNTISLQGDIAINSPTLPAALIFLQSAPGSYTGTLTGNGILQIGNNTLTPFPQLTLTADSSTFSGATNIFPSGVLNVTGSLSSSTFTIQQGGLLQGTGVVGPTTNSGSIQPGNSIGVLTVNGDLVLNGTSNILIGITPTAASRIDVLQDATLTGTLTVLPEISGFYGLGNSYTILTNVGLQSGTLTPVVSDPNFIPTIINFPQSVVLNIQIAQPFLNFPYENPNEQSVGENIDALVASGNLTANSPLGAAINSLIGFPDAAINHALDQMHPAPFSAFAEIQAALGGQLLSMFHRRPVPGCACFKSSRLWVEPYGNWLKEKSLGYQVGFNAISKGIAAGIDTETEDGLIFGLGAGYNDTQMQWRKGQGQSTITGYYGGLYVDYTTDNFYLGLSGIAGYDACHSSRHIRFSTINEHATGDRHNLEMMGQLATAIFFGPSACFAFPYLNIDYFYLQEGKTKEQGAPGLNLWVDKHSSTTLRSEVGFAVQVQDINRNNTMCIAPLFGLGWAMEMPLDRPKYQATFENQPIPFYVKGWDYTWQLFTLRFGLTITYRCLSLAGSYIAEMSPLKQTPFFDQRGDIRLEYSW